MSVTVSELRVFPVKGCQGVRAAAVDFDARGPVNDRRFMVIDEAGQMLTQRNTPKLAWVSAQVHNALLMLQNRLGSVLALDAHAEGARRTATVWDDLCEAIDFGDEAARWLTEQLGVPSRLVRMADDFERKLDPKYGQAQTGFSDGFPILLLSEASLADLNGRLETAIGFDRFRPNVVVKGCEPYAEDGWKKLRIGEVEIELVKPCARCVVTTTHQQTLARSPEPLRTLASYRRGEEGVNFGQNGVHRSLGTLRVGDTVEIL